tara:strand:+ start:2175 stop:3035 length:861 start_codon:yes stop_codon:yes gene_type:complete
MIKITLYTILSLFFSLKLYAQSFSDGPMTLKVRVTYVYIDDYYDVWGGNQEPRWKLWVSDDANYDGTGWAGGNCIEFDCPAHYWVNGLNNSCNLPALNTVVFNHNYNGSTVPSRLDLRLEGWEDDGCGSNCTFSDDCFWDDDDAHSGPQTLYTVNSSGNFPYNILYRDMGPPCQWNGSNGLNYSGYEFFTSDGRYGVQINTYWQFDSNVNGLHTWNGFTDNDWNSPCNWNTSHVPDANDDVLIPSGAVNSPIIYGGNTGYCNTIEIESGGNLEVQTTNNAKLIVTQ